MNKHDARSRNKGKYCGWKAECENVILTAPF